MNALIKAVDEIKFRIPKQILMEVFTDRDYFNRQAPVSIDEQITNKVLKSRVMVDCNLTGGAEVFIPLSDLIPQRPNDYTLVYRIPKDKTQGRSIMSALSVGYASQALSNAFMAFQNAKPCSVTPELQAAQNLYQSHAPIPLISGANLRLIAENTILIRGTSQLLSNGYLRAVIANDDEMSHLQMRSIPSFCNLAVLATKAYIYNEATINIDLAKLSGGMDLGKFKEIVDSYADAEELYQEYLHKTFSGVQFMNDEQTFNRFMAMMIGSMR